MFGASRRELLGGILENRKNRERERGREEERGRRPFQEKEGDLSLKGRQNVKSQNLVASICATAAHRHPSKIK